MLTKAGIDAFPAYTIRNLDKQITGTDIDQYKVLSISNNPVNDKM